MTTLAIGTEKGAFLFDPADTAGPEPIMAGWHVTAFGRSGGHHLLALGSNWFGYGLQRSTDLDTWTPVDAPPAYPGQQPIVPPWEAGGESGEPTGEDAGPRVSAIWTFHRTQRALYAGVEAAGLFRSHDDGETWEPVTAFNEHPTRPQWQPGLGGLCAHRILGDESRLYVGASAVGVFRSDDGLESFQLCDEGVPAAGMPEGGARPETGFCVHNLCLDPNDPNRLWRQDHVGLFRSSDGGDSWQRIENGVPASFGFVMWRDHGSGRLFTQPLHSDEQRLPVDGQFRVYHTDDDGDSWAVSGTGWDDAPIYTQVLRGAVDGDGDGTVAMGTTSGNVYFTDDNGATWRRLPHTFPRILSVAVW